MNKRNLIIVRAGKGSLHRNWSLGTEPPEFDLYVSYFEPGDSTKDTATYTHREKGLKWDAIGALIERETALIGNYDAVWIPDDDIDADAAIINRMFRLFHANSLWLAQPALGKGSHIAYAALGQVDAHALRFVSFVEIMCPIFERHVLRALAPTFRASASGWGLDFLWPLLLGSPKTKIAVIDQAAVIHTRPFGGGGFYKTCDHLGVDPRQDLDLILRACKTSWSPRVKTYGSIEISERANEISAGPRFDHTSPTRAKERLRSIGVERGVCINLNRRRDRWTAFTARSMLAGLGHVERVDALDGDEMPIPPELASHGGAYGRLHSHCAVYKTALRQGNEHLLVFEDDCEFLTKSEEILEYINATIANTAWIHLGGGHECYPAGIEKHTSHAITQEILSSHAYVINRRLMLLYVSFIETTPYPKNTLLHSDRLLLHLCKSHDLQISMPLTPLTRQDKAFKSDNQWGVPK